MEQDEMKMGRKEGRKRGKREEKREKKKERGKQPPGPDAQRGNIEGDVKIQYLGLSHRKAPVASRNRLIALLSIHPYANIINRHKSSSHLRDQSSPSDTIFLLASSFSRDIVS